MADMNYVSPLTSDLTDYYTKSEVDELQQGDAATYATSAEIVAGDNAVKGWVVSQGFLTEHQDLTNYATISYVDDAIAAIEPSGGGMAVRVVNTLPAVGEENVLYLVFVDNEDEDNRYAEYVWVDTLNDYEMLGFSSSEGGIIPDLTDYATKQWVEAKGYLVSDNLIGYATVSDLADFATKDYVDDELANKANSSDLAAVATSGDYDDLSNKPTIPSLTGYATEAYVNSAVGAIRARDVAYDNTTSGLAADTVQNAINEVNDKVEAIDVPAAPDLSPYATKAELSAKANTADLAAVATTGSYNDLSNKPAIPTVPANVSAFNNDAGYLTAHQDISGKANTADLATVAFSGDYDDLANKPSIPSTSGLASESYVDNAVAAITVPTSLSDLDNDMNFVDEAMAKAAARDEINNNVSAAGLSGSYNDLDDKPTIPSLSGYATEQWVGQQGYLTQHQDISGKANTADLSTVATSGSYNDLTDKPTIPAAPDLTPYATKQELTAKADAASLASVATSGDYDDLINKPTIPSDWITSTGNGTLQLLFAALTNASNFNTLSQPTNFNEWEEAFNKGYLINPRVNINLTGTGYESGGSKGITWYRISDNSTNNAFIPSQYSTSILNTTGWCIKLNDTMALNLWNGNPGYGRNAFIAALKGGLLTYSNTTSGLTATTIQGAIDELAASSGGGIGVQDVIDEFNTNGLTLDDGTANKVEILNSDITATSYQGGTEQGIDWSVDTYSTTAPDAITFGKSVSENDTQTQGLSVAIHPDRNYETLEVDIVDVANNYNDTKTLAFQSDIPSGYEISETYDDRNKALTLSVVESSGM